MKLRIFFSLALIAMACSKQGALAQERDGRDCPVISVSHAESTKGGTLTYKVNIQNGDPSVTPTFNWTVAGGKITSGQGNSEVSIDAEGNNSITVTVEVMGYAGHCQNKASNTRVVERGMSRKFDEYGELILLKRSYA